MKFSKITGTGSYLPEKIVTNADLEKILDTSDEWIQERTGIKERRWIEEGGGLTGAGADYRLIFRFVSATAFACYFVGMIPSAIWYKRRWSTVAKSMIDCLIYALLTGGFFGWLWPAAA